MAIDIRHYREEDIEGIIRLFNLSFGGTVTKEWLQWKYGQSPWGAKGYVACDSNKVVAYYGGIRMKFDYNGSELWAYQLCDVMTHPEYRGKMFSKTPLVAMLGEKLYEENEMDFAFGFPSLRHAKLQALRLGGEGYRLIRQYKKEAIKKRFSFWGLKTVEGWQGLETAFFERVVRKSSKDVLNLYKNKDYINWRYVRHPLKKYNLIAFKRFGFLKGFVVFSVEQGCVNILELFYDENDSIRGIITSFENHVSERGDCKCIKCWCHPNEQTAKILEEAGYVYEDHIPIAFKSVNKGCGIDSTIFYGRFYYRMGDYDAS